MRQQAPFHVRSISSWCSRAHDLDRCSRVEESRVPGGFLCSNYRTWSNRALIG